MSVKAAETVMYGGEVILSFNRKSHSYRVIDGGEALDVPSVTQILGVIDKSGPLTQWAANQAIESLRMVIRPGVAYDAEQLESFYQNARFNFRRISKAACDIGSMAHQWIELWMKSQRGEVKEPAAPKIAEVQQSCRAALNWMSKHNLRSLGEEAKLYSRQYRYAGTMDWPAVVDGEVCIIDWKTSKAVYDEYRIQTSAYLQAWNEMGNWSGGWHPQATGRYIIRIDKESGEFEVAYFSHDSWKADFDAFLAAKALRQRLQDIKCVVDEVRIQLPEGAPDVVSEVATVQG